MSGRPGVGDVVHYVSHGTPYREDGLQAYPSVCRAAIVTAVPPDGRPDGYGGVWEVSLCVLNPTGVFFDQEVLYDPSGGGGTWHWRERSDGAGG
jgi:hypothetical protein